MKNTLVICRTKGGLKIVAHYDGREYEHYFISCGKKEAERIFRERYNLKGKHLKRRETICLDDFALAFNCF